MTRKQRRQRDPFQHIAVEATVVGAVDVADAIRVFVDRFVIGAKSPRALLYLLASDTRARGLRDLWRWLDRSKTETLEGSSGFPQHLRALFGDCTGVYIDYEQSCRVTAAEGAMLAQGVEDCAMWVADDGTAGLVFAEIGPPVLCRA